MAGPAALPPGGVRDALIRLRELDWRDGKREAQLLKNARLKVSSACVEDIDWRAIAQGAHAANTRLAGQAMKVFETSWASPGAVPVRPGVTYPRKAHGEQSPDGRPVYGK